MKPRLVVLSGVIAVLVIAYIVHVVSAPGLVATPSGPGMSSPYLAAKALGCVGLDSIKGCSNGGRTVYLCNHRATCPMTYRLRDLLRTREFRGATLTQMVVRGPAPPIKADFVYTNSLNPGTDTQSETEVEYWFPEKRLEAEMFGEVKTARGWVMSNIYCANHARMGKTSILASDFTVPFGTCS